MCRGKLFHKGKVISSLGYYKTRLHIKPPVNEKPYFYTDVIFLLLLCDNSFIFALLLGVKQAFVVQRVIEHESIRCRWTA